MRHQFLYLDILASQSILGYEHDGYDTSYMASFFFIQIQFVSSIVSVSIICSKSKGVTKW